MEVAGLAVWCAAQRRTKLTDEQVPLPLSAQALALPLEKGTIGPDHRHYNCSQIGHMKIRAIILSLFLLLPLVPAMAQKKDKQREVIVCGTCGRVINSKASFDGGDANKFSVWVNEHKRYPEEAKKAGIEGRVTTQFTITKEGKLTNVRILRGLHPLLDEEAVRVIESAPQLWEPAWDKKGEPTDVTYTFPVIFKLTEEERVDYPIRWTVQY